MSKTLENMLSFMGYPDRESAHQVVLAASLRTKPELTAMLVDSAAEFWPSDGSIESRWGDRSTWPNATTRVHTEITPNEQRVAPGQRRCRFDIVVRAPEATAIIECKWAACTDADQLQRYAKLLLKQAMDYPRPVLVLVSAEGAPPRYLQRLGSECGLPIFFVKWSDLLGIVAEAAPELAATVGKKWAEAEESLRALTTEVLGSGIVPLRDGQVASRDDDYAVDDLAVKGPSRDEDGAPDSDFPERGKGGGRDGFVSASVTERVALHSLAIELTAKLDWEIVTPAHTGPRNDVQCDIAPSELAWPERLQDSATTGDAWLLRLGTFDKDKADDATQERFASRVAFSADPTLIGLRMVVRLYFSPKGQFKVIFGANIDPYLIGILDKKQRASMNAAIGGVGEFRSTGEWLPGEKARDFHTVLSALQVRPPVGWVARRRAGSPKMWQTYVEIAGIAGAGGNRVDRIVQAIKALLNWTDSGGQSEKPQRQPPLTGDRNEPLRRDMAALCDAIISKLGGAPSGLKLVAIQRKIFDDPEREKGDYRLVSQALASLVQEGRIRKLSKNNSKYAI